MVTASRKKYIRFENDKGKLPDYLLFPRLKFADKQGHLMHVSLGHRQDQGVDSVLVEQMVVTDMLKADSEFLPSCFFGSLPATRA